jgi:hypothetical protein
MRPVCWSQSSADEGGVLRDAEREAARVLPEATPTEEPGVFVEQPYERWSPRDVFAGLARLVRSTGAAIVRGTAAP